MSSVKGQYTYTTDAKGRLNVPAKFRKALDPEAHETFVAIPGLDGCVSLYPLDEWKKYEEKLRKLPANIERYRRFQRMIFSQASEDTCDKQGRISIPDGLLKKAGIEKDVLIVGAGDRIELWNPERFQKMFETGESYEEIAENIMFDLGPPSSI